MYNAIDKAIAANTNPSTFDIHAAVQDWSVWLLTWELERDVQEQLYDCFLTGDLEMEDFVCNTTAHILTLTTMPGRRSVVTVPTENNVYQPPTYAEFVQRMKEDQPIDPQWDWWFSTQTLEDYRQPLPVASTPVCNPVRMRHHVYTNNLCRL